MALVLVSTASVLKAVYSAVRSSAPAPGLVRRTLIYERKESDAVEMSRLGEMCLAWEEQLRFLDGTAVSVDIYPLERQMRIARLTATLSKSSDASEQAARLGRTRSALESLFPFVQSTEGASINRPPDGAHS